jgi:hypothetical protein
MAAQGDGEDISYELRSLPSTDNSLVLGSR